MDRFVIEIKTQMSIKYDYPTFITSEFHIYWTDNRTTVVASLSYALRKADKIKLIKGQLELQELQEPKTAPKINIPMNGYTSKFYRKFRDPKCETPNSQLYYL